MHKFCGGDRAILRPDLVGGTPVVVLGVAVPPDTPHWGAIAHLELDAPTPVGLPAPQCFAGADELRDA